MNKFVIKCEAYRYGGDWRVELDGRVMTSGSLFYCLDWAKCDPKGLLSA